MSASPFFAHLPATAHGRRNRDKEDLPLPSNHFDSVKPQSPQLLPQ